MLEVRVRDHGVERAVREGQRLGVEIDLLRLDPPRPCPLRADPGDVRPDDVDPVVFQQLGEKAGTAAGIEDVLSGGEKVQDELQAGVVDLAFLGVRPVIVVVGADIHSNDLRSAGYLPPGPKG
jgi:hypothetical protein